MSTAPHRPDADTFFEVTHPFHPLKGQKFKLVVRRHNWGDDRVFFHNAEGQWTSISANWTTVVPEDPFVTMAAGRSLFRFEDLLKLTDFLERLR